MSYKAKLNFKLLCYWILSFIELLLILGFSLLLNRLLEMVFTIIGFFILRSTYEKQYHAKTLQKCALISAIVMGTVAFIELPNAISILFSLLLSLFLTWVSYYVRDYLDLKDRFKMKKVKITKGISEDDLNKIIEDVDITEVQKDILRYYYNKRYTITKISNILHYSYDYIVELKSKALKELNK